MKKRRYYKDTVKSKPRLVIKSSGAFLLKKKVLYVAIGHILQHFVDFTQCFILFYLYINNKNRKIYLYCFNLFSQKLLLLQIFFGCFILFNLMFRSRSPPFASDLSLVIQK